MTPHFSDAELACRCGCGLLPPMVYQQALERTRVRYGLPMKVNSGARCAAHDIAEGGVGPHREGAFDIGVSGANALLLVGAAIAEGATGIGVKQHGAHEKRLIHIDFLPAIATRPRPTIWSYP